MIVMKFGGTSVGDAEAIKRVVANRCGAGLQQKPVVVVSAMARVTDQLLTHGARRRSRRARDRAEYCPRSSRTPLQHRRRVAGDGSIQPVSRRSRQRISKRWTN